MEVGGNGPALNFLRSVDRLTSSLRTLPRHAPPVGDSDLWVETADLGFWSSYGGQV